MDGLPVQHGGAATSVVAVPAPQPARAVPGGAGGACGHVARTLRDHRHQPAPGFPPLVVGNVPPDDLGLPDVLRLNWGVPVPVPAVHPAAADDLHFRDARLAAGRARARGGTMRPSTPIFGLMAEFKTA